MPAIPPPSPPRTLSKQEHVTLTAKDLLKALLSGPAAENFFRTDPGGMERGLDMMWGTARYLARKYVSELNDAEEEQRRARLNQNAGK